MECTITARSGGTLLVVRESGLDAVDWDEAAGAAYAAKHGGLRAVLLPALRDDTHQLITQGSATA